MSIPTLNLPHDFSEFLKSLNSHQVDYLLVGGYAVAYHGYPRYTGDIDIWIAVNPTNASRTTSALKDFGFDVPELSDEQFLEPNRMTRMGREPIKIEILTSISGLTFEEARPNAIIHEHNGISIPIIALAELRKNKAASARHKDLDDLENLPTESN
ncbi:MAG: hypothetical protein AAGC74_00945 [Verrucomicrobiota bacterium]